MSLLIHATVTITGEEVARAACEERLRRLLSPQFLKDEVAEHHGADALCYDLKVEGGIPFPVFAQASQEFPALSFVAEWVNVAAGEKGLATIVNGRVTRQTTERIATGAGDDHPIYVEVGPDGKLTLAFILLRTGRAEWRGYALTATRDALLHVLRLPESGAVELYATEGAAEWEYAWRGDISSGSFDLEQLEPPVAIEDADYQELEQIARRFVSDWIWFASERSDVTAVESERYARYGYAVSKANVNSARLHRMRADAGAGQSLIHNALGQDDLWVREFVFATWVAKSRDEG